MLTIEEKKIYLHYIRYFDTPYLDLITKNKKHLLIIQKCDFMRILLND